MPLDLVVTVDGVSALNARLGDSDARQRDLVQALHKAALVIQRRAVQLAPVRTGSLRRSIFTQDLSPMVVAIQPGVNYGGFVELGTKHMAAQPYLFPAAEETVDQVSAVLAEVAARITSRIAGQS